jgi:hypothetical protein
MCSKHHWSSSDIIYIQVSKNFIDDVILDGGFRINIIIKKLIIQSS